MVKKAKAQRKAWRNADIGDVEEALEDDRLVEKMKSKGEKGPKNKHLTKTDEFDADGLFTVDVKGSSEGISAATKRELARAKCFPEKAPKIGMSASETAKVDRKEAGIADRGRPKATAPDVFDLWGAPPAKSAPSRAFPRVKPTHAVPHKKPRTVNERVGLAPAVVLPHEGQSMNPDDKAYEDLACEAAAAHIAMEREAEEIDRKLRPITHELRDLVGAAKLEGMDPNDQLKLWSELTGKKAAIDGDDEEGTAAMRRKGKMKSQSARNKTKKLKGLSALELQERQNRNLEKSVGDVGSILKDMKRESRLQKKRREYRDSLVQKSNELEKSAGVVLKKRKLGRVRFREGAVPVPDSATAGAKGLRAMPLQSAMSNAVQDRMQSIARRGLIPTPFDPRFTERSAKTQKNLKAQGKIRKFMSPLLRDNLLLR